MLSKVLSGAIRGIEAFVVEVETDVAAGLPSFSTVGLPDGAVRESRERVASAIANSGLTFPLKRITVNLAPADVRKAGSAFDLPMALGVLAATGQLCAARLGRLMVLGELSLDGALRPIRGGLSLGMAARESGLEGVLLPQANAREVGLVRGIASWGVASLPEAVAFVEGRWEVSRVETDPASVLPRDATCGADFEEVRGQEHARRALEVAAAGGHNVLMVGPPGAGKTMLAHRLSTILPDLTWEEALETSRVHSVAGLLDPEVPLVTRRPFRAPHHTISDAGLIGGGGHPRPGEVSLAHNGVLFLDELPEFRRSALEVLRQPVEEGQVTIARASQSVAYPARFMLACAMNPCPCGFATDGSGRCTCTPSQVQRYLARVSGPLLDRIDIQIEVPPVRHAELARTSEGETSAAIRERVDTARAIQAARLSGGGRLFCNAQMGGREVRRHCPLETAAEELLGSAMARLGLSARGYYRVLKVARTIADLDGARGLSAAHVAEAIQYRSLDRVLVQ